MDGHCIESGGLAKLVFFGNREDSVIPKVDWEHHRDRINSK